jgi:D-glycero-alpha-D-manno-heptose-7-phosphate kinase
MQGYKGTIAVTVEARAPSRIDLAGGTLDIYPLYLFEEGGVTVNLAISVYSYVRLETRDDGCVRLLAEDLGLEQTAPGVDDLELGGDLDLIARIIRFYRPSVGLNVFTRNDAPHGSGLGASSSLLIALSGALRHLNESNHDDFYLVRCGANLEAQNLGIPTGKQDYYPALFGGLNAIWFGVDGDRVEALSAGDGILPKLEERLVLTFTGESRCSGTNNWSMLKCYIDNEGTTCANMKGIKETALDMRQAFLDGDLDAFGALLDQEWCNRRSLAEGVTNERIERLMAAAREAGAVASRLCGAGGGGCMTTLAAPGRTEEVTQALVAEGAVPIPFTIDRHGLQITAS